MLKKLSMALLMGGASTIVLANGDSCNDATHPHHNHHKHTRAHAHAHTTTTTHTQTTHTHVPGNYFKSGFFAGLHTGYVYGHGKFNSSFVENGPPVFTVNASGRARSSSALYGIHGGYEHLLHNGFIISGQVKFTMYGNSTMSTNLNHAVTTNGLYTSEIFKNSLKRNYSFIPSINFGKIFWHRYHAYVGLGIGVTRFEHQVYNVPEQKSAQAHKTKLAFIPAIGLNYALDNHFIIGTDISYEIYQNISNSFSNPDISRLSSTYTSKIKPRYFNARVGISYKF